MCFGGSKTKEVKPPPPTPPTTFDYSAGQRAVSGDGKPNAAAPSAAPQSATFGSELGGAQPMGGM